MNFCDLFDVMCTSIIYAPSIVAVIGIIDWGLWFEYPSNFFIIEKSTSSNLLGYLGTQYNHLIFGSE